MTAKRLAFVFPGQGSQFVGMGKDLAEGLEGARTLLAHMNDALGRDLSRVMFEGPEDELKLTVNTQPAVLACSVALFDALAARGIKPSVVAGHSLGEYAALYASGALAFDAVLGLVKLRSELMQNAYNICPGSMAAVLGIDDEKLNEICAQSGGKVVVANYNAPGQTVISGEVEALAATIEKCKAAGAKRALPLPVTGAFHSPLMAEPNRQLSAMIDTVTFADAMIPIVMNVDGAAHTTGADICETLRPQMTSSVMWTKSIHAIIDSGVDAIVEVGPGKVLAGLIKRINKDVPVHNVGSLAELEALSL